jgi:hypothetical protein
MNEPWRDLKVGDRVRIVQLPTASKQPGYYLAPETRRLYKQLIARRRSVRISHLDACGLPYIYCRFRQEDGSWEHHWLAVNDDSWVKV